MNCHEVESIITDMARDAALEAGALDGALAHLNQCAWCAERASEQKKLSQGLRAWAAALADEQAPPELEQKLRAAFRQSVAPAPRRRWIKIAAAASIAAGILLVRLNLSTPRAAPPALPVAAVPAKPGSIANPGAGDSSARLVKKHRQARRLPRLIPARPEVATEFLPVAQGDGWTPLDGGRLVRVRLPRSAMGAFGLPVDAERGPEQVQADVMLSDDGLLRAIRFVQ